MLRRLMLGLGCRVYGLGLGVLHGLSQGGIAGVGFKFSGFGVVVAPKL